MYRVVIKHFWASDEDDTLLIAFKNYQEHIREKYNIAVNETAIEQMQQDANIVIRLEPLLTREQTTVVTLPILKNVVIDFPNKEEYMMFMLRWS